MGKYIVFEVGETRAPLANEVYQSPVDDLPTIAYISHTSKKYPILRRLTDEEVAARLHPVVVNTIAPAQDDERARFVRETAARQFERVASKYDDSVDKWRACREAIIDICIEDAESLAARLWEKRS